MCLDRPGLLTMALRASFSIGGPSLSTGMNWMCLCGWLMPLCGPPEEHGTPSSSCSCVSQKDEKKKMLTVVERDKALACLASGEEELIGLREVGRRERGSLRLIVLCGSGRVYETVGWQSLRSAPFVTRRK